MFYSIFCNFDELSILIIWVRFHTSIFSVVFHLSPFRFALIQNFWYLYSTKFENPKLLINVISQLSRLWNFQFHISAHISNLFLFSTSFSRKWNLNFMFLASSTSNSFNHLGPFLLQHLHLKMFHKPVGFGVPKFILVETSLNFICCFLFAWVKRWHFKFVPKLHISIFMLELPAAGSKTRV